MASGPGGARTCATACTRAALPGRRLADFGSPPPRTPGLARAPVQTSLLDPTLLPLATVFLLILEQSASDPQLSLFIWAEVGVWK